VDVYKKTLATDGVAGLYRGFTISCVGIIVYRGLYFGMYDSLKPVVLTGNLAVRGGWGWGWGWGRAEGTEGLRAEQLGEGEGGREGAGGAGEGQLPCPSRRGAAREEGWEVEQRGKGAG
jgi:hypothetical protein